MMEKYSPHLSKRLLYCGFSCQPDVSPSNNWGVEWVGCRHVSKATDIVYYNFYTLVQSPSLVFGFSYIQYAFNHGYSMAIKNA